MRGEITETTRAVEHTARLIASASPYGQLRALALLLDHCDRVRLSPAVCSALVARAAWVPLRAAEVLAAHVPADLAVFAALLLLGGDPQQVPACRDWSAWPLLLRPAMAGGGRR